MIRLSRPLVLVLAALFSAFQVALGLTAIGRSASPWPALAAMALYAAATALSLGHARTLKLPAWLAIADLAAGIAVPLLCDSQLDAAAGNGYATWYVAAIGALFTILAVRGNTTIAWLGMAWLTVQTIAWAGLAALATIGVIGSLVWIFAAMVVSYALQRTAHDVEELARAERQATAWRAGYEAHVGERRRRLERSYALAAPLLGEIVRREGGLDEAARRECLLLESTMRDEIRGRGLLDDAVRAEVERARRRGASVSLLDDGGLDELDEAAHERVLGALARALAGSNADSLIVRSIGGDPQLAVTVVGLKAAATPGGDDEVELWLEIPRA